MEDNVIANKCGHWSFLIYFFLISDDHHDEDADSNRTNNQTFLTYIWWPCTGRENNTIAIQSHLSACPFSSFLFDDVYRRKCCYTTPGFWIFHVPLLSISLCSLPQLRMGNLRSKGDTAILGPIGGALSKTPPVYQGTKTISTNVYIQS